MTTTPPTPPTPTVQQGMTAVDLLTTAIYIKAPKYTSKIDEWESWAGYLYCCMAQNGCGEVFVTRVNPIRVMTMTER